MIKHDKYFNICELVFVYDNFLKNNDFYINIIFDCNVNHINKNCIYCYNSLYFN